MIKAVCESIVTFFEGWVVLIDESKRQNLDGEWDSYWERKNRKQK